MASGDGMYGPVRDPSPDRGSDAFEEELRADIEAHYEAHQAGEKEAAENERKKRLQEQTEAERRCELAKDLHPCSSFEWEVRNACIYAGLAPSETVKVVRAVIEGGRTLHEAIERFKPPTHDRGLGLGRD